MLRVLDAGLPDLMIHLGDGESDLDKVRKRYPLLPIENVRGNCDRFSVSLKTLRMTFAGKRIFATHGHLYDVKYDAELTRLRYAALEDDADIVLFGHTHRAFLDEFAGMKILNPGSCGRTSSPSFGLITIENNAVSAEIRYIL
jgi:putative phosphoesterase